MGAWWKGGTRFGLERKRTERYWQRRYCYMRESEGRRGRKGRGCRGLVNGGSDLDTHDDDSRDFNALLDSCSYGQADHGPAWWPTLTWSFDIAHIHEGRSRVSRLSVFGALNHLYSRLLDCLQRRIHDASRRNCRGRKGSLPRPEKVVMINVHKLQRRMRLHAVCGMG